MEQLDSLEQMLSEIEELKQDTAQLEGAKLEILKQIKEMGVDSIKDLEIQIKALDETIKAEEESTLKDYLQLKETYDKLRCQLDQETELLIQAG